MSRTDPPYLPLYIDSTLLDVYGLTVPERGVYLGLVLSFWHQGGELRADPETLYQITAASSPAERALVDRILTTHFERQGDTYTHARLTPLYHQSIERRGRYQRSAAQTNQKRAAKRLRLISGGSKSVSESAAQSASLSVAPSVTKSVSNPETKPDSAATKSETNSDSDSATHTYAYTQTQEPQVLTVERKSADAERENPDVNSASVESVASDKAPALPKKGSSTDFALERARELLRKV
jgi:uncharacterized protein YdaU (DUF1376 family)